MQVNISKKYWSVEFESHRIKDLVNYLNKLDRTRAINFQVELKDNETAKTEVYEEFAKELDDIRDWKKLKSIAISQYDFRHDFRLYMSFDFEFDAIYGYRLSVEHNERAHAIGIAAEIEKILQLRKTANSIASPWLALPLLFGIISLTSFLFALLSKHTFQSHKTLFFAMILYEVMFLLIAILGISGRLYRRVRMTDASLNKTTSRSLKKDAFKIAAFLFTTLVGGYITHKLYSS